MLVPSGPVLHISVVLLGVVELCSCVGVVASSVWFPLPPALAGVGW